MKIKYDDHTIVLPVEYGLHLIYDCTNSRDFLECLLSYFGQKKKESEDKFVDGTYQSDENLLNNISTLNKHGA